LLILFTEIFPVNNSIIPEKLFAYKLDMGRNNEYATGARLSYKLKKYLPGRWIWSGNRIVTDIFYESRKLYEIIEHLWKEQPEIYRNLKGIDADISWKPSPKTLADYVAWGLIAESGRKIDNILAEKAKDIGNASIERVCDCRGWEIDGRPSVSLSISSHLIFKQDLASYISTLKNPEEVTGLMVGDKNTTAKGEIVAIAGKLCEHRTRLISLTTKKETEEILAKAPDDDCVVTVVVGRNEYDYTAASLRLILRMEDLRRFKVNRQTVLSNLRIEPERRSEIISEISKFLISRGLIEKAYNSKSHPGLFIQNDSLPHISFGNNQTRPYESKTLLKNLRELGLYKKSDRYIERPLVTGIINTLTTGDIKKIGADLKNQLKNSGFSVEFLRMVKPKGISRKTLESAVESLKKHNPDIILAFFPDSYTEDEEDISDYYHLKSLTIGQGIASQVIEKSTLKKDYAAGNILMGILGKTGNIPYILSKPLSFADFAVGLDVARERKKKLAGSINCCASTRIYLNNGELLHYALHDMPVEGETIPKDVLQRLFPARVFSGKRVVIHRDGYFRGREKEELKRWSSEIGATFYPVEIIKRGNPRIYAVKDKKVQQPPKGAIFKLNNYEALVVSSLPPFKNSTPQPLKIKTEEPLSIEDAVESVLSLTLLHYGSLCPPKLPVTVHSADRIAYLALRGIRPKDPEGDVPYWL